MTGIAYGVLRRPVAHDYSEPVIEAKKRLREIEDLAADRRFLDAIETVHALKREASRIESALYDQVHNVKEPA